MLGALRDGFRALARNWGLVPLVLGVNLALALVLALPLAAQLEKDLAHSGASRSMMYGFDFDWWSAWHEKQNGPSSAFRPDTFGTGFAFKNLDLLLRGALPAGLFREAGGEGEPAPSEKAPPRRLDPVILGVGALYLLVQVFLTGGLLGVLRAPQGGWTFRGLVHGAGFYCARLLRVSLLALSLAWLVFAANVPFSAWVDAMAREAVSERTALVLGLGRNALLLLALLVLHAVASHARVMVVREERQSAALALLSSLGFCARNALAVLGQYAVVIAAAVAILAAWAALDARLGVNGWTSQLVALAGFEIFLAGRIALRLGLLGGQIELQRARVGVAATTDVAGKGGEDRV
jgi:uncharacterized protein with GYD domain